MLCRVQLSLRNTGHPKNDSFNKYIILKVLKLLSNSKNIPEVYEMGF